jgi:cephalosporin-C deacetylase-like acetyl esterase
MSDLGQTMTMRDYLSREARRITDRAHVDCADAAKWRVTSAERRRQFLDMMGLEAMPSYDSRPPLNVRVTGVVERPAYRIEKLYYESLPQLYVTANLYIPSRPAPTSADGRYPGVLYVCGHADTQKVHYQSQPRRFAELGFVCLAVETVQLGEVRGYHHGCYREGWWHWYSRGYSPAAIELWNGIRGLDLLTQRADVDPDRLGVTGMSGGGAVTWFVAAGDERIKVAASVCGTATLASQIGDRTIDGHCDCMWWVNTQQWDLADLGALIAPRPLMIASADRDPIFTIASIREVHQQLSKLYGALGVPERLHLVETPGGHSYHERSRTAIYSLFIRHLQGREIPPEQVGDSNEAPESMETEEALRVFVNGPLPEDRTPIIQDSFIALPEPPPIEDREGLERVRQETVTRLRETSFRAFPADPPDLAVQIEFEFANGSNAGYRFAFTSEEGWRLHGRFHLPADAPRPTPATIVLRNADEERDATDNFMGQLPVAGAKLMVEPRGTGDTAWGQDLQWHLRRAAAWTGRTIASMRVWDTLRALEAVRSLPEVDGKRLTLAAQGEMAAVALYAALLDGGVERLILQAPPPTQNGPSRADGRGEAIEVLGCLRITDLPQVAGLLYPAEIVLIGRDPELYSWAEGVYRRLGAGNFVRRIGQ